MQISVGPSFLADSSKWTDEVSAVGTLAGAVFAMVAIIATMVLALRDRDRSNKLREEDQRQAARDRADSDQRLREEREAADRRLREEREAADRRQVRDWQAENAIALLHRIADLHPHLAFLATHLPAFDRLDLVVGEDLRGAVGSLQRGAHSEALALGSPVGTVLYRNLVHMVMSLEPTVREALDRLPSDAERAEAWAVGKVRLETDLRRYSRYVRLWLCELIEKGEILSEPQQAQTAVGDLPHLGGVWPPRSPWTPQVPPPGWSEDTDLDPADPQFRAAL
ncbi:hypothetical protein ABTZ03_42570 [Kitasatospora sp. NPDC096077]|uniref:hypothetical protein n=1 Tax=Kitasatospora sp. NPDC096077 TaxID=3155544 RepID=UPI003319B52A